MTRAPAATALAALILSLAAAAASAQTLPVTVQFQAFAPDTLDALPGDTVAWRNEGGRTHTVTADNRQFDSGDLADGGRFSYMFTPTGSYTYHCIIHRGMTGEVDVRRVTLEPLPPAAVTPKTTIELDGRTADPTIPVHIESDAGAGFQTVASASPHPDGSWSATVTATKTSRYRASSGSNLSETRRLLVIERAVHIRATRTGISVKVLPSAPYARIALEFRLHDRFGWWIVAERRLDYVSRASFRIHRRGRVLARVVLLGPDRWTPVAISRAARVGPG